MSLASSPALPDTRLADIVTADSRTAAILDRAGLDYCCHGHQTLVDAAAEHGVALDGIVDAIGALVPRTSDTAEAGATSDLGNLTRHIVEQHHAYVRETTPIITAWLDKLVTRHGAGHPELSEVQGLFAALSGELLDHMLKEEAILFPFIEALAAADRSHLPAPSTPFGTIANPIRAMEADHREAGDVLARIRKTTNSYLPPAEACTTYRLCFEELARFESDLHRHVHLENYELFPRAVALEARLG